MYTQPEFNSILYAINFLSISELEALKAKIDITLRLNKRKEILKSTPPESAFVMSVGMVSDEYIAINHSASQPNDIFITTSKHEPTNDISMPLIPVNSKAGIKQETPVQISSRPLGIWKGQVEISKDFYETSSDILSDFGVDK